MGANIVSFDYDRDTGFARITYKAFSPTPHIDTFVVEISPEALLELLPYFRHLEKELEENNEVKSKARFLQ